MRHCGDGYQLMRKEINQIVEFVYPQYQINF